MRYQIVATLVALVLSATAIHAQDSARTPDPRLTQKWTSEYGYTFFLPEKAKYNKLGSEVSKAGQTERQNYILPGGCGSIMIYYFAEGRMVPKDYKMLDSNIYYDLDSAGRNGMIHRRVYILRDIAVQMDVLLTDKGTTEYGDMIVPIFDSFVPPPGAARNMDAWRYGRNPKEFEHGRYGPNSGPDRR